MTSHALDATAKNLARRTGISISRFVDGLAAEREQGITIDVAYRYFTTGEQGNYRR